MSENRNKPEKPLQKNDETRGPKLGEDSAFGNQTVSYDQPTPQEKPKNPK